MAGESPMAAGTMDTEIHGQEDSVAKESEERSEPNENLCLLSGLALVASDADNLNDGSDRKHQKKRLKPPDSLNGYGIQLITQDWDPKTTHKLNVINSKLNGDSLASTQNNLSKNSDEVLNASK